MTNNKQQAKDDIYKKKKEESITSRSFLSALKENLEFDLAFKIASDAFNNYMIETYINVLKSTEERSQERFDRFREFYENYAAKNTYLEIMESSPSILKVKYIRCPFFEVLKDMDLQDFAQAFCLSDIHFTNIMLPGVQFSRNYEIATGGPFCDIMWVYCKKQ